MPLLSSPRWLSLANHAHNTSGSATKWTTLTGECTLAHVCKHTCSPMQTFPCWYQSCHSWWPGKCVLQYSNTLEIIQILSSALDTRSPYYLLFPPSVALYLPYLCFYHTFCPVSLFILLLEHSIIPLSQEGTCFFMYLLYWLPEDNCLEDTLPFWLRFKLRHRGERGRESKLVTHADAVWISLDMFEHQGCMRFCWP